MDALSTTAIPDSIKSIFTDIFPFFKKNIVHSEILLEVIFRTEVQVRGGNA